MGTKKIGGSSRNISWGEFDVRGFNDVEIESSGDNAHIELEGISSFPANGTLITPVIDLDGLSETISWGESLQPGTSISVKARFLDNPPLKNRNGNNWFDKQLPSNFDYNWGYYWNNPQAIAGIKEPFAITQILTNYNCLVPSVSSSSYAVVLSNDPGGYFWYSNDAGVNWTKSGSAKSYLESQSVYPGTTELLTGCLTRYFSGGVLCLAQTQLLGLRLLLSNSTGSNFTDITSYVESVLQTTLTRNTLLATYIRNTAEYCNILVGRSINGIGYILNDTTGASWTKEFESTKLINPLSIAFSAPKNGGTVYIGSIYESDRGWKSAYFSGTLGTNGKFSWKELTYSGGDDVTIGKENVNCGVAVVKIDGTDTPIALSSSGALYNLETNTVIENLEGLKGGRLIASKNSLSAIAYSTNASIASSYLFEPYYFRTQPSSTHQVDNLTSILQVIDFSITDDVNWRMIGSEGIEEGVNFYNWNIRNDFSSYTNGQSTTSKGRFAQFKLTLTGA